MLERKFCHPLHILPSFPSERREKNHSKARQFFLSNTNVVYITSWGTHVSRSSWQVRLTSNIFTWTASAQPKSNKEEENESGGPLTINQRWVTILNNKTQHEADI